MDVVLAMVYLQMDFIGRLLPKFQLSRIFWQCMIDQMEYWKGTKYSIFISVIINLRFARTALNLQHV